MPLIVGQFLDRIPAPDIWTTGGWQDVLGGAYFGLRGLLVLLVAVGGVFSLSSLVAMEVTVKGGADRHEPQQIRIGP